MNMNDHLDAINNSVNNDSVHDVIMGAIADYCNKYGLDPDGFTYTVTVDIAE